jgi:hypothetical protein
VQPFEPDPQVSAQGGLVIRLPVDENQQVELLIG